MFLFIIKFLAKLRISILISIVCNNSGNYHVLLVIISNKPVSSNELFETLNITIKENVLLIIEDILVFDSVKLDKFGILLWLKN